MHINNAKSLAIQANILYGYFDHQCQMFAVKTAAYYLADQFTSPAQLGKSNLQISPVSLMVDGGLGGRSMRCDRDVV